MCEISIIIPHYKNVSKLMRLLDSIPCEETDVIVVDDNSLDDDQLNDLSVSYEHVRFVRNSSAMQGAGAARNVGLELAVGHWVLFADSDDVFVNGFLDIIRKHLNSECDVIYFKPTSFEEVSGKVSDRHVRYELLIREHIKNGSEDIRFRFYVPWSKLIKKSFIEERHIKFDQVRASNDVMFSTKVGVYARLIDSVDEIIYRVEKSSKSLTSKRSEEFIDCRLAAVFRYNDFVRSEGHSHRQIVTFPLLFSMLKFGFYKFLYLFFYAKHKGFPVFISLHQIRFYLKGVFKH